MCCCEKAFQNQGIGSKLVQSLVEDLEHRSLPCFNGKPAEEIVVDPWGCHNGFPESLPRFRKFWHKNGFKEDMSFPDPQEKAAYLCVAFSVLPMGFFEKDYLKSGNVVVLPMIFNLLVEAVTTKKRR